MNRIDALSAEVQCGYHWGSPISCRAVQLNHDPGDPNSWQVPIWCCEGCRVYLNGQFRYVRSGTHRVRHPQPRPTIEPLTNMRILLSQAEQDGVRLGV